MFTVTSSCSSVLRQNNNPLTLTTTTPSSRPLSPVQLPLHSTPSTHPLSPLQLPHPPILSLNPSTLPPFYPILLSCLSIRHTHQCSWTSSWREGRGLRESIAGGWVSFVFHSSRGGVREEAGEWGERGGCEPWFKGSMEFPLWVSAYLAPPTCLSRV